MARSSVSLRELMDTGLLKPGQVLVGSHRGARHTAEVLPDGSLRVRGSGETFRSASLAANSVTKRNTNGWLFWTVDLGDRIEPLATLRDELAGA